MVRYFRRRRLRRPFRSRRRRWNRFRRGGYKRLKRTIQRVITSNYEKKYVEGQMFTTFNSIGNTWTELDLTNITQSVGNIGYTGTTYRIKSIMFYGLLQSGTTGTATDDDTNLVRIILANWKDAAGGTPVASAGVTLLSQSPNKATGALHLQRKFMDRTVTLINQCADFDGTGYIPQMKKIKYFKRFRGKGLPIVHEHNNTHQLNHIYLSMISDSSAVPNPGFITGWWRIKYIDT